MLYAALVSRMIHSIVREKRRLTAVVFACFALLMLDTSHSAASEALDLISGIVESPQFRGKDPLSRLRTAADLLRSNEIRQTDIAFLLLDWGDRYLREPSTPLERLKRWSILTRDKKLSHLRIPRDYLNRILLAEYLVKKTPYLESSPLKRLELIRKLQAKDLVDWSVALAYSRLYAGAIISGAKEYETKSPVEALVALKQLEDQGLIDWHYQLPTEALLVAEAIALEGDFHEATPLQHLVKLRDFERKGLINPLNRKDLEKLPAWRFLMGDPSFLRAGSPQKQARLLKLRNEGLITPSTYKDLVHVFRPATVTSPIQASPAPLPEEISPRSR